MDPTPIRIQHDGACLALAAGFCALLPGHTRVRLRGQSPSLLGVDIGKKCERGESESLFHLCWLFGRSPSGERATRNEVDKESDVRINRLYERVSSRLRRAVNAIEKKDE